MISFLRRFFRKRKIYFHEDDYCQQQLLPREVTAHAVSEIEKIDAFAAAHRAADDVGWTDIYIRNEAPSEFRKLNIQREHFASVVSPIMPPFDIVLTGYSSLREPCKKTGAWGISERCAIFADWDDRGVVTNVWTEFFDSLEESVRSAARVVAALGKLHPLVMLIGRGLYLRSNRGGSVHGFAADQDRFHRRTCERI